MSEIIGSKDVAYVARLARLDLGDEEIQKFTSQLEAILGHASKVKAIDTTDVEPTAHPLPITNVFRSDTVGPSLERAEVLACAPAQEDGQFKVPPLR